MTYAEGFDPIVCEYVRLQVKHLDQYIEQGIRERKNYQRLADAEACRVEKLQTERSALQDFLDKSGG